MKLLNIVKEILDVSGEYGDSNDIVTTFQNKEHYKWMDYLNPEAKISKFDLDMSLKYTLDALNKVYGYILKRIVVKDDGEIVGFLIYSYKGHSQLDDIGDGKIYPVLLSTAVHPNYRNKGLLKMMVDRSELKKPFLVHVSLISPPGLWEKFGCKVVKDMSDGNKIMKCE
jgi:ribosomal protein S18 acetylase RimI-like enzyme